MVMMLNAEKIVRDLRGGKEYMTEKRFTIVNMGLEGRYIKEDGKIMEIDRVVDLLNENEQLKRKLQRERTSSTKQHLKWSNEAEEQIKELSEENELLKSVNMEYEDALGRLEEENQQLTQKNKRLAEKIQRQQTSHTKQHLKWSNEAEKQIKELSEENNELKQFIQELTNNEGKIILMNGYVYNTDKILKGDV